MIAASTLGNPSVLALFAAFMFGLALVLTQFGLRRCASPLHGALVSIPTAAAFLWILAPLLLDWRNLSPAPAVIFAAVGLFFPATVTLLTFEANRQMGPSVSGALANLSPLFAVLSAMIFLHDAPRPLQAFGIGAIIVGVLMLSMDRRWLGVSWSYWAVALPIGAAAIRGFTHPITKLALAAWPNPFAATLIGYTVSGVVVASIVTARPAGRLPEYDRAGLLWFAFVGICNSVGVLALYDALARGSILVVSPLVATYPLVTVGLTAALFRSVQTSTAVLAGVVATVAGVIFLIAA
jgi:drug/metabolite transporter (DMT)-like permease